MQPFRDRFGRAAADYAAYRPSYPPALVDWLVALAGERSLAWDAGCGSGQLSVPLARGFQRVVASDASAGQVAAATLHARVHYRVARAEASGLPSGVVDLAVAAQAAHWFDLEAYFDEVDRVGKPGSHVVLICYGRPELPGSLDRLMERFHRHVLEPFWPPERRHVEAAYRTLSFPFPEVQTPDLVARHRWDLDRLLGYVGTWTAVRRIMEREGPAPLESFGRELGGAWGDPAARLEVRWPLGIRAGRVGGTRP